MAESPAFTCGVVEGFYGRPWTPEQRKDLFRRLAMMGMNAYVYAPKDDLKHRAYWRELYTLEEADLLQALIESAKQNGIQFYYAISPGLDMTYSSQKDINFCKHKLDQVKQLGCNAFAVLFDDIEPSINDADKEMFDTVAQAQVHVTNAIYSHLNPSAFMFCPTEYCESRSIPSVKNSPYLIHIGLKLHPQVMVMWTGPRVVSRFISVEHMATLADVLHRKPIIWDNLHANDYDHRRVFLGPYHGRPVGIKKYLSGIVTNPNCEFEANWPAMHTLALWSRCGQDFVAKQDQEQKPEILDRRAFSVSEVPDGVYHPIAALQTAITAWVAHISEPRDAFNSDSYSQKPPAAMPLPVIPDLAESILQQSESGPNVTGYAPENPPPAMTPTPSLTPSLDIAPIVLPPALLDEIDEIEIPPPAHIPMPRMQSKTNSSDSSSLSRNSNPPSGAQVPDEVLAVAVNSLTAEYDEPMETASCSGISTPLETGSNSDAERFVHLPSHQLLAKIGGMPLMEDEAEGSPPGDDFVALDGLNGEGSGPADSNSGSKSGLDQSQLPPQRESGNNSPATKHSSSLTESSLDAIKATPDLRASVGSLTNAMDVSPIRSDAGGTSEAQNGPDGREFSGNRSEQPLARGDAPGLDQKIGEDDQQMLIDGALSSDLEMQIDSRGPGQLPDQAAREPQPSPLGMSSDGCAELSRADVELLTKLFYLPFEHSPLGYWLVLEFCWLRDNAGVVSQAMETGQPAKMEEWKWRAAELGVVCAQAADLCSRLSRCPNRGLVYDLYPYVWDAVGILLLLDAYIKWLGYGYYKPPKDMEDDSIDNDSIHDGKSADASEASEKSDSDKKEPVDDSSLGANAAPAEGPVGSVPSLGLDYEAWVFRGGLFGELQRLLPLDSGQDLFTIRPPCPPTSQVLYTRPYQFEDKQSLFTIARETFDDGFDSTDRFSSAPELPGDCTVGHILEQYPQYTFVALDSMLPSASIVGFATAVFDSSSLNDHQCSVNDDYDSRMRSKYPHNSFIGKSEGGNEFGDVGNNRAENMAMEADEASDGAKETQDVSLRGEDAVIQRDSVTDVIPTPGDFSGKPLERVSSLNVKSIIQAFHRSSWRSPILDCNARYPCLMHLRVLPPYVDSAVPKRLTISLLSALKANGSPGVHVRVRPAERNLQDLYARLGFFEIPAQPQPKIMGSLASVESADEVCLGRIL